MVVFSRLCAASVGPVSRILNLSARPAARVQQQSLRWSHDETFIIRGSTWGWKKARDEVHFYLFLTGVPFLLFVFGINIFIGPAELAEIPEGYEPEEYEYHRHPITRWFVRNFYTSPQLNYEKAMHFLEGQHQKITFKRLTTKVRALMKNRGDYQGWYFVPLDSAKHIERRIHMQENEIDSFTRMDI